VPEEQGRLKPLDPPMVPIVVVGMALWAVAALVVLPFRDTHPDWLRICVWGLLVAIPGLLMMLVHDANRRRRRAT
jgi:hypothetical protein